jgi:hypothetical protein
VFLLNGPMQIWIGNRWLPGTATFVLGLVFAAQAFLAWKKANA